MITVQTHQLALTPEQTILTNEGSEILQVTADSNGNLAAHIVADNTRESSKVTFFMFHSGEELRGKVIYHYDTFFVDGQFLHVFANV